MSTNMGYLTDFLGARQPGTSEPGAGSFTRSNEAVVWDCSHLKVPLSLENGLKVLWQYHAYQILFISLQYDCSQLDKIELG